MQYENIIGIRRGNMFSIMSIGLIGCVTFFTILVYFKILPLKDILNSGVLIFVSVLFGIPYLFAVLKFLDKKPMIIVDSKGVSLRKSRLPFSGLQQIDWKDIKDYDAKIDRFKHGKTMFLTVTQMSTDKKYYVDLFDLNIDNDEILTSLEKNLHSIYKY